jgi:hypothetical protein
MRTAPRVDSKKFDIAVGHNDSAQRPSGAEPLCQVKIRNSGRREIAGLPYPQLIGQIARQEMKMVRD